MSLPQVPAYRPPTQGCGKVTSESHSGQFVPVPVPLPEMPDSG